MRIEQVKPAPYNPALRTDATVLSGLLRSIEKYGIIDPLLVTSGGYLIDGHRRLECAKQLGYKSVPVTVTDFKERDVAFETCNSTSRKLSAREVSYVYLHGGTVSPAALKKVRQIETLIGRKRFRVFAESYISISTLSAAKRIARYVGNKRLSFLRKSFFWLIDNKQNYIVRKAMEDLIDPLALAKSIRQNKPLAKKWG